MASEIMKDLERIFENSNTNYLESHIRIFCARDAS